MILLSIDPGSRNAGAALWEDGRLLWAHVFDPDTIRLPPGQGGLGAPFWVDSLVIERPIRHKSPEGKKVRVDDLITLGVSAGTVKGAVPHGVLRWLQASQWKGAIPKPASARAPYLIESRAWALLTDQERPLVHAPAIVNQGRWDVWDAVGIGLVATGRASRGLV